MRNLIIYYLAIILPLPLLVLISWAGYSRWFAMALLIYALPYRIAVDGFRLVNKRLMKGWEVWKLLIPGKRWAYTWELYFRK